VTALAHDFGRLKGTLCHLFEYRGVRPFFGLSCNSSVAIVARMASARQNMRRAAIPERARLIRRNGRASQLRGGDCDRPGPATGDRRFQRAAITLNHMPVKGHCSPLLPGARRASFAPVNVRALTRGRQVTRTGMTAPTRRQLLTGTGTALTVSALGLTPAPAARPLARFRPRGGGSVDHAAFDAILSSHVARDGKAYNTVRYRALKGQAHSSLKAYIASLEAVRPSALSAGEAHAYWINLYNAATLDVVADHYPVTSIRNINLGGGGLFATGPWSREILNVEDTPLSLDDIEHRIVRPVFSDPMSHYGLNCASYSCPNLAGRAYTGANVDALLAQNARDYINHPRGVSVASGRITASRLYAWYAADFGGKPRLKQHWREFAEPGHAAAILAASLGRFVYDWSLNDVS
jgi:hypothetical protein